MVSSLDGITVLDLTWGMAGALATMLLCDNGARVIGVDSPAAEGSRRSPGYAVWDRGKESISLDLSNCVGRQGSAGSSVPGEPEPSHQLSLFHRLVRNADVLVDSFPPSSPYQPLVADDKLLSINPRLVHCSITAYGRNGPLKDHPPNDDLVMARTGILAGQPSLHPGPAYVVLRVASVGAGILAAQGIVASLYDREKTGRGRSVETSLLGGALHYAPKVTAEKLELTQSPAVPEGGGPFYNLYECADGEWIQLACIHSGFVDLAASVMDIAEVMADPKFADGLKPDTKEGTNGAVRHRRRRH